MTKTIPTKAIPRNFNKKEANYKIVNFCILPTFLLTLVFLLIIVSIYCYHMKHWSKQKHVLQYHITNNKLKETDINNTGWPSKISLFLFANIFKENNNWLFIFRDTASKTCRSCLTPKWMLLSNLQCTKGQKFWKVNFQ